MTYEIPANEELRQIDSVRQQKKSSRLLLAAVSIFVTSLGITAARSAIEIKAADGSTARDSNTKLAETKTHNVPTSQSNQIKGQTNQDKQNTMTKPKIGPDPRVMLNPQPLPPEK